MELALGRFSQIIRPWIQEDPSPTRSISAGWIQVGIQWQPTTLQSRRGWVPESRGACNGAQVPVPGASHRSSSASIRVIGWVVAGVQAHGVTLTALGSCLDGCTVWCLLASARAAYSLFCSLRLYKGMYNLRDWLPEQLTHSARGPGLCQTSFFCVPAHATKIVWFGIRCIHTCRLNYSHASIQSKAMA